MSGNKKYTFRKILVIAVWILLGSGTVVLLVAAITKKDKEKLVGVDIHISGVQNNYFIDKTDVIGLLEKVNGKKLDGAVVSSLNLAAMEKRLEKEQWVRKAEIFFDNNNVLQVKILEREPVARIFTSSGASFYIDSSLTRLPLSDKFSARLPVFTNFPTEVRVLKKHDSVLLTGIKSVSEYIGLHPFWMAQIDQIDITPENDFELIPKLGNQIIRFGNADNYEEKFNKLLAFYQQVQVKIGWNQYSVIDVQFKNQVIGVKRDAAEIKSDSLQAIRIMKSIIAEAQKNSNDSTKIQLPQPSDDNDKINSSPVLNSIPGETMKEIKVQVQKPPEAKVSSVTPIHNPIVKKEFSRENNPVSSYSSSNERPGPDPVKKAVIKNQVEKKEEVKRVPKAVMPLKSEY